MCYTVLLQRQKKENPNQTRIIFKLSWDKFFPFSLLDFFKARRIKLILNQKKKPQNLQILMFFSGLGIAPFPKKAALSHYQFKTNIIT